MDTAIYYLNLAADQNLIYAQRLLGSIYNEGNYVNKDIEKSIYFYSLAANQNDGESLFHMGMFYIDGKHLKQDIKKGIQYITKSASYNFEPSLNLLGVYYYYGLNVPKDLKKGMNYLLLAVKLNSTLAALNLGIIYLYGFGIDRNVKRAKDYLIIAAKRNSFASFLLGTIYLTNVYYPRNINKSIFYYKQSSNLNQPIAKNNLAMIYKNGIDVQKNIPYAIELLKEAIRIKTNEIVVIYNLFNIYLLYEENGLNEIIKLISSLEIPLNDNKMKQVHILLCLALVKKYKNISLVNIKNELKNLPSSYSDLPGKLYSLINYFGLKNQIKFNEMFEKHKFRDYIYVHIIGNFRTSYYISKNNRTIPNDKKRNITKDFYEGFGIT